MTRSFELDQTYEQRARELIDDAEKSALRNRRIGPSVRGYIFTTSFREKFASNFLKAGVNFGSALAGGALIVAGAASAGVTFGIGPLIGLTLGFGAKKLTSGIKYQYVTKKLRKNISHSPDEENAQLGLDDRIQDIALLEAAVFKVQRKLGRVTRRSAQLKGGLKGAWNKVRHMHTALSARHKKVKLESDKFPGLDAQRQSGDKKIKAYAEDLDLNHRLLELNYYAQMLGNFIQDTLDEVIGKRDHYIDCAKLVYAHILRQVHFTGNHKHCGNNCYTMDESDLEKAIRKYDRLSRSHKRIRLTNTIDVDTALNFYSTQHDLARKKLENANALMDKLETAQDLDDAEEDGELASLSRSEGTVERYLDNPVSSGMVGKGLLQGSREILGTQGVKGILHNVSGGEEYSLGGHELYTEQTATFTQDTVTGELFVTAGGQGLDILFTEIKESAKKRLLKRAVLKKQERAFNLLQAQSNSQLSAEEELKAITKGKDILPRSGRVAQKIMWYVHKIGKIEPNFAACIQMLEDPPGFEFSRFPTCKSAWRLAKSLSYLFKQYEKLITFLVYMEAILMTLDHKVAKLTGIPVGEIYAPDIVTPKKPQHMQ